MDEGFGYLWWWVPIIALCMMTLYVLVNRWRDGKEVRPGRRSRYAGRHRREDLDEVDGPPPERQPEKGRRSG